MKKWQWALIIFLFFFLRLYHLDLRLNFSMDQGMEMLRAWELWQHKTITLLGPSASPTFYGHQFFFGPITYYLLVIFGLVSNWDPFRASMLMTLVALAGMMFLYLTAKKLFNQKVAVLVAILFSVLPLTITYSIFLWNPNFLLGLVPIYLYCLVVALGKNNIYWYFLVGLLGGLCLQLHFQTILLLLFSVVWLLVKKINFIYLIVAIFGFVVGYSPLIIFDIRNHFYNFLTMIEWLGSGGNQKFSWQSYYLLALWPAGLLFLSWFLARIKNRLVLGVIILGLVLWSTVTVLNANQGFGMPKDWHYVDLVKTAKLISTHQKKYNIVNLLSGDTRFYSLRYLLTITTAPPLAVDHYKEAETLYVISNKSGEETVNDPVWEVDVFGGKKIEHEWQINKTIKLYKIIK